MALVHEGNWRFAVDEEAIPPPTKKEYVESMARDRLRHAPYHELRRVVCEFHEGVLTLRGFVSSYYLKQVAQVIVAKLEDVERLHNRLEVLPPASKPVT